MSERKLGAIAVTLDPTILLTAARAKFAIAHPEAEPTLLNNGPLPQMLFPVNRGEAAIVNNEGVGSIADEDDNIQVTFTYGYQWLEVTLTLDEINQAATDEKIDLADGIRTFGSRLDSNHYNWFSKYDHNQ